ncbi:MAG: Proteasome-activating nucleotidase 1 [Candidatus Argoarchaeum ethanivorans]|uniref:Proteasome-activating nucleotidase 1 n=1 Tax=Candidatus Argoarchaeum ethanivorans TaxID=2608793 RepID=A0A811ZZJ4_9EURY|nr:MAG: Proteasome-activating nucleotidase 1 [Candidatus Argoarchaeum ethanivorans]
MSEALAKPSSFETEQSRDVLSLLEEIEVLKVQNEELRSKLLDITIENGKYLQAINKFQEQVDNLRRPPLFIATVIDIVNGMAILRQHGSNQEILTYMPKDITIDIGSRVAVNNNLSTISVLSKSVDVRAQVMELVDIPEVDYDVIGGLKKQIEEVVETIELPLAQPELFKEIGIDPPNAVLLHGPPGTGKTLIAKAVAHRTHATFLCLSGTELVQKYIGEGARLVRDLFQMARDKTPSIVFIDEIDSVASMRSYDGSTGSAEVNRTMIQLLAEIDGFRSQEGVKIIAATNRIDLLDQAILRPGRFDRIIEIPLPDESAREEIFKIHTRKMKFEQIDFKKLAKTTAGLSGADIKAMVTEAGMFALRRSGKKVAMDDVRKAQKKIIELKKKDPNQMFA